MKVVRNESILGRDNQVAWNRFSNHGFRNRRVGNHSVGNRRFRGHWFSNFNRFVENRVRSGLWLLVPVSKSFVILSGGTSYR